MASINTVNSYMEKHSDAIKVKKWTKERVSKVRDVLID